MSSVGLMAASSVEQSSVEMTATLAVTVTETLFLVPNSLFSFNLEEKGFMKILQAYKYSKTVVQSTTQSKGMAFVKGGRDHRGGRGGYNRGGRGDKSFDKYYWK